MSKSSNAVLAKVRGMYGKKIKPEQYKDMLTLQSVSDVAQYLKNETGYKPYLAGIQEGMIHRGQLENLLHKSIFEKYTKLLRFSDENEFYSYMIKQGEITQILNTVRLLNSGTNDEYIISLPGYIIEHAEIDLICLGKVKTFEEMLDVLKKNEYANIVRRFAPKDGIIDVSACEAALNSHYYNNIFKMIDKGFHGELKKELGELFASQVDIYNLSVIYRLKRFFDYDEAQTKVTLLEYPEHTNINSGVLSKMISSKNYEELIEIIKSTKYGKPFAENNWEFVEDFTEHSKYNVASRAIHFSSQPPVVLVAYMVLMTIEVGNIINIIEGIRYQIPAEEIEALLIK